MICPLSVVVVARRLPEWRISLDIENVDDGNGCASGRFVYLARAVNTRNDHKVSSSFTHTGIDDRSPVVLERLLRKMIRTTMVASARDQVMALLTEHTLKGV